MKWSNVKLIFSREIRDQLRDRRTLFTVAILPLILYPLLGMSLIQVTQFMREHPTRIWIVGSDNLPDAPPLIANGEIADRWANEKQRNLLQLELSSEEDQEFKNLVDEYKKSNKESASEKVDRMIQKEMENRNVDLAVFIPSKIDVDLESEARSGIFIFTNSASDKSKIAFERFNSVMKSWQESLFNKLLASKDIKVGTTSPVGVAAADVAGKVEKQAALWSKVLPLVIMIWCLTGAFYPAVDLVAGEKERGTFETLLSSPAHRSEIAYGKLFAVMTFSIITAILNLISMGFTGLFVMSRISGMAGTGLGMAAMGPPPVASIFWLLLALIPVSALFSALSLAAAAFARSSKEGQYYLVPLIMFTMPLMMLPMLPAAKLDMGTSLIPITGLMLLLRGLIEGNYTAAIQFGAPVVMVTLVCCWFAVRWVINQFKSETVLFRASERFGIGAWFKQIIRDRNEVPMVGYAILCGITILVIKFFVGFALEVPTSWFQFAKQTVIVLVAAVAVPAIMMALVLTTRADKTLKLRTCRWSVAAGAVLMAIMLHPLVMWASSLVMMMYPPTQDLIGMEKVLSNVMSDAPSMLAILCVFALAPAVMEEIAYRGFILSGLESLNRKWTAILVSALFFGAAHAVIQQSIITFGVGFILGIVAVQTRSLIPCILYHATHNGLSVIVTQLKMDSGPLAVVAARDVEGFQYGLIPGILMSMIGVALLVWFIRLKPEQEAKATGDWSSWLKNPLPSKQSAEG